jgi:hypothetical protein
MLRKRSNSRRARLAGHVARMGEKKNSYRLYCGKARKKETTRRTKTQVDV